LKHIIKPAFSLLVIAAISTAALALVRGITLEPIENQRKITQERVKIEVLPQASGFREISVVKSGSIVSIFEGLNENELVGYVLELAPSGYSGAIHMMVGISAIENKLAGMRVMKHTETPGLGSLATEEKFYRKYDGRDLVPIRVVRTNAAENEIETITSATITTRAITNAVNEAIEWFNEGVGVSKGVGASKGVGL
jgi:electron transport complex protein RnfG